MPRKSNEESEAQKPGRISLPLKEDGTIDFDAIRPATQEKFLGAIINDPFAMEKIGLASAPDESGDGVDMFQGISEENMRAALDVLTKVNGLGFKLLAGRLIKHPFKKDEKGKPAHFQFDADIVDRTFVLTEEQHRELDPRATRLANKYSPEFLKKNSDVVALVGMYLMYMSQNAQLVLQHQFQRDVELVKQAQAKANGATKASDSATTWKAADGTGAVA